MKIKLVRELSGSQCKIENFLTVSTDGFFWVSLILVRSYQWPVASTSTVGKIDSYHQEPEDILKEG